MPTFEKNVSNKRRRFLDEASLWHMLQTWNVTIEPDLFLIERVNGLPGQSAPAAFTFGYGVGVIVASVRALGWRIEFVEPAKWKREMRAPKDKKASRERASQLLPKYANLWHLAKNDGRAEAAMLALYGDTFLRGRNHG